MKNKHLIINNNQSISKALRYLKKNGQKCLIISNEKRQLLGSLSDGDIRNYLLKNNNLKSNIINVYNKKPIFIFEDRLSKKKLLTLFSKYEVSLIPMVNKKKQIVDVFVKDDLNNKIILNNDTIPVLIMAGGKGVRLKPFTEVLPKPLIPLKGIPIIQIIINKFYKYNFSPIFISLNYKDKIMKAYLNDFKEKYDLHYINENKPLGTIGSAKLISDIKFKNLIVTNCDILLNYNYKKILDFHLKNRFDVTVIGVKKKLQIPYGLISKNKNTLIQIKEKPTIDFQINGGLYIFKKSIIDKIPKNKKYDLTDLVNLAIKNKNKIGVYEISENKWGDIGQWDEYKQTLLKLKI